MKIPSCHAIASGALLLALLAMPSVAEAQTRGREAPPWEQSEEDLESGGWEFLSESAAPGSALAGFAAGTGGFFVHGIGHWMIGDDRVALQLLLGQLGAMTLVGSGLLLRRIDPESEIAFEATSALIVGGAGLHTATWAADVLGAFRGTGSQPGVDVLSPDRLSVELWYSRLFAQGLSDRDIPLVRVPIAFGPLYVLPEFQSSIPFNYRKTSVESGPRIGIIRDGVSYLGLYGRFSEEVIGDPGVGRTQVGGVAELALSIGDLYPHLQGVVWRHRQEARLDAPWFESDDRRRLRSEERRMRFPSETALLLTASPLVTTEFGYAHDRDELVGGLSRRAGYLFGRLAIVPAKRFGVEVRAEQGAFFRLWLGLRWTILRGRHMESSLP